MAIRVIRVIMVIMVIRVIVVTMVIMVIRDILVIRVIVVIMVIIAIRVITVINAIMVFTTFRRQNASLNESVFVMGINLPELSNGSELLIAYQITYKLKSLFKQPNLLFILLLES
ncbi:hypothetical protein CAPTEDRAFT_188785 [Capitella teleta]|uniref:G-protein coupled receptors family 1 profile domain-containing protein n=1 Tax=Capitella teleta TaxID=283909 RepID=R7VLJ0_CAPTE|nr:hypothetical protein CAPTEDRAFT_188785 [Capitella teleta]|eukprot:ELU17650.1 hypothetical protein CAPTEDRAFT_188785 [Capitella teleta]